ncbi:Uncharacterized protein APZ42_026884 [Daphnia magna]|uniref:Uncharacterized protein n=1 Tax=Daphnia magna TaxID=35525 RepID=A0A164RZT9_9CRUS|nr:Uncharacterized protein APZ42_026884 [Daphnia magna]
MTTTTTKLLSCAYVLSTLDAMVPSNDQQTGGPLSLCLVITMNSFRRTVLASKK